jgi:hypothetical protein
VAKDVTKSKNEKEREKRKKREEEEAVDHLWAVGSFKCVRVCVCGCCVLQQNHIPHWEGIAERRERELHPPVNQTKENKLTKFHVFSSFFGPFVFKLNS